MSAQPRQRVSGSKGALLKTDPKEGRRCPPTDWKRCHYYDVQKKRFCRQHPVKVVECPPAATIDVPRYCGNHQHLLPQKAGAKRKRIPCPIDPSHMIFEDMIARHSYVCPKLQKLNRQRDHALYSHKLNTRGHGRLSNPNRGVSDGTDNVEWAKRLALRLVKVHQQLFRGEMSVDAKTVTLDDIHNAIPLQDLSSPELQSNLVSSVREYNIRSGGQRHLHQQASLIGHLRRIRALNQLEQDDVARGRGKGALERDSVTFLEVGAGRGMLGLMAAGVASASGIKAKLVMVERDGSRSKADTLLRKASKVTVSSTCSAYLDLSGIDGWCRVPCDLSHADMRKLLDQNEVGGTEKNVVVIAKHLCGVGTDLALKSLEPVRQRVSACVMATCCHGICVWDDYVGRDYLSEIIDCKDVVFGRREFELMTRWSAGTVRDTPDGHSTVPVGASDRADGEPDHEERSPNNGVVREGKGVSKIVEVLKLQCGSQGLGRVCQRLIDFGRQEYIRNVLFPRAAKGPELLYYVPPGVTPQNAALVVVP